MKTPELLCIGIFVVLAAFPVLGRGNRDSSDTSRIEAGEIADGLIDEEIDYLGIAALMVRDENYARAETALANVDPSNESTDLMRYYTLGGLIKIQSEDYKQATKSFELALSHGQQDPLIHAYLGQTYYALGEYQKSVDAISKLTNFDQYPDLLGIKTQGYWKLGEVSSAFSTLEDAVSLYPDQPLFLRQQIYYLIELDLTREAIAQSAVYLSKMGNDPNGYLTIGDALRRGNQSSEAINVLEMANLRFPEHDAIRLMLAQAYADVGSIYTAAEIVEAVSHDDSSYYYDAAELFRRKGVFQRALYLNSLIVDPKAKAAQRFNILLQMERYEQALSLESRLHTLGLIEDDTFRYALAYVNYQTGRYGKSVEYIEQITTAHLVEKAALLRNAIEAAWERDIRYF